MEYNLSYLACNFYNNIALGRYSNIVPWSKIGYNGDVNNVEEDLISQGGTYTWLAAASTMNLVSTSATDNAGGVGARTVTIYGLTAAGAETSETVTMTGTTTANTIVEFFRINNMRVATTGTNYKAVGNLILYAGTTTCGYIVAGYTRQRQCVYTVPTGKTLYVTSLVFSSAALAAGHFGKFTTRATFDDKSGVDLGPNFFMPFHEVLLQDMSFERDLEIPTKLGGGIDLKVTCLGDASNSGLIVSCALRGFLTTP